MSYRVPAVGETWRSISLPSVIAAQITDLSENEATGDVVVHFLQNATVHGNSTVPRPRLARLTTFVQHFRPIADDEVATGSSAPEVAVGAPAGGDLTPPELDLKD